MNQLTLSDFFDDHYMLKPKMAGGSKGTAAVYKVDLKVMQDHFDAKRKKLGEATRKLLVSDLSIELIHGAMKFQLDRGRAKATANRVRRVAVLLWNYAHEKGKLPTAAPKIERFTEPKRDPLAWSIEEFETILYAASQLQGKLGHTTLAAWFTALLWVVYNSGLRINAAMATRWDWIDFGQKRLVVDPDVQKDNESQTVILLPETVEALRQLQANNRPGVFDDWPYDRNGTQWPALTKQLKKCIVSAGLSKSVDDVSRRDLWHKIRRTFGTAIYIASGDIEVAREMLGHSSSEVTWRYIDKSKLGRKSQAELLPRPKPHRLRVFNAGDAG